MQNNHQYRPSHVVEVPTVIEDPDLLPIYATEHAAGADVRAYLKEPITILPGESALIPTGMRVAIPEGHEIQVRPRSGLALKHQLTVLNTPGTIDADYRGELAVILINHGKKEFVVTNGMRIAQLILAPVLRARYVVSTETTWVQTARGSGGFGHTGHTGHPDQINHPIHIQ